MMRVTRRERPSLGRAVTEIPQDLPCITRTLRAHEQIEVRGRAKRRLQIHEAHERRALQHARVDAAIAQGADDFAQGLKTDAIGSAVAQVEPLELLADERSETGLRRSKMCIEERAQSMLLGGGQRGVPVLDGRGTLHEFRPELHRQRGARAERQQRMNAIVSGM